MDEFRPDDECNSLFYSFASQFSCASDADLSSIFNVAETCDPANRRCVGKSSSVLEEWMMFREDENNDVEKEIQICAGRSFGGKESDHPDVADGLASSSISPIACDRNLLDLRSIIVDKRILEQAVERLGGGKHGARRLWDLIQIWLKHRARSTSEKPQLRSNLPLTQATASSAPFPALPKKSILQAFNSHSQASASLEVIGRDATVSGQAYRSGKSATASALAAPGEPLNQGFLSEGWVQKARSSANAAATRAARKHKMARQRKYFSQQQAHPASLSPRRTFSTHNTTGI